MEYYKIDFIQIIFMILLLLNLIIQKQCKCRKFYELLFKNKPKFFKIFQKLYSDRTNDIKIPKTIGLGADIRTRDNNYLMYPLDENIKKIYYPKIINILNII